MPYLSVRTILLAVAAALSVVDAAGQATGRNPARSGITHRLSAETGLATSLTTSIAQTADGLVWIGTQSGLNIWDGRRLETLDEDLIRREGEVRVVGVLASGDSVLVTLADDRRVALRAGRNLGVEWLDGDHWTREFVDLAWEARFQEVRKRLSDLGILRGDSVSVGGSTLHVHNRPVNRWGIRFAQADREGGVLLTPFSEGVVRYGPLDYNLIPYRLENGAPAIVSSVLRMDDGRYLADIDGIRLGASIRDFGSRLTPTLWPHSTADSRVLFGISSGIDLGKQPLVRYGPEENATAVLADSGGIWALIPGGLLVRSRDGVTDTLTVSIEARVLQAAAEGVWILGRGVVRCTWDEDCQVVADSGDFTGEARFLWHQDEDRCWLGTYGAGLVSMPCEGGKPIHQFGRAEGLLDRFVNSIVPLDSTRVLLGGHAGLYTITRQELESAHEPGGGFEPTQLRGPLGARRLETNGGNGAVVIEEDRVLLPSVSGMVVIRRDILDRLPPPGLPVLLEARLPNGLTLEFGSTITLSEEVRSLHLQYLVPSLAPEANVWLEYKINDGAVSRSRDGSVSLVDLGPGWHELAVWTSELSAGITGDPDLLRIHATPRFLETDLYKAMLLTGILGLLLGVYVYRMRSTKRQAEWLQGEVSRRTEQLARAAARAQADNKQLMDQTARLVSADTRQRRTFGKLGQELRIPAVLALMRVQSDTDLAESTRLQLQADLSQIQRMATELDERGDSQQKSLQMEETEFREVLLGVVNEATVIAERKGLKLQWRTLVSEPLLVRTDVGRLRHVLRSMLVTGVRAAGVATPRLLVELSGTGTEAILGITVETDSGYSLKHLMEPHWTQEAESGLVPPWIGLTVARHFCDEIGALLSVSHDHFELCLGLRHPVRSAVDHGLPAAAKKRGDKAWGRVVICTTADHVADFVSAALQPFTDVERVAADWSARGPDRVVDILLTDGSDQMKTVRALRESKQSRQAICVLLQIPAMTQDEVVLALQESIDAVLPMPIDTRVLVARLQGLLDLRARSNDENLTLEDGCRKAIIGSLDDSGFDVNQMAEAVGLSYSQLARRLKEQYELTPTALIRRVRAEQAAQLVGREDLSISQIAFEVGFQSLSHFNRAFRERFGSSPTEFRAKR